MTEANEEIPNEIQLYSEKKKKLLAKKEWTELTRKLLHIQDLSAHELVELYRTLRSNENPFFSQERRHKEYIVQQLRNERLARHGKNPDEWVFSSNVQPENYSSGNKEGFTEEDMAKWQKIFPEGLEFFVIQGQILPGSEYKPDEPFSIKDQVWEIYIKEKPKELESKQLIPKINETNE